MGRHARSMLLGAFAIVGCRERNPAFQPDAVTTSTGDGGSTSTGVSTSATTDGTTTATPTTSLTTTVDPDTGDSGASSSSAEVESSSSEAADPTGEPDVDYAPCTPGDDESCPRGWDRCIAVDDPPGTWCSHECNNDNDCEAPPTGDAEVVCAGPSGSDCALDCSDGQTCPDGMSCEELFAGVVRCIWLE